MFTSLGTALLVISILFPIIATCAVGLRVRARAIKGVPLALDDWTLFLGLIFAYMDNFSVAYGVYNSDLGIPQNQIMGQAQVAFGKVLFTETLCWQVATATIKVSILLLYRRIFVTKRFRFAVHVLIAIDLAWMIGNIFSTIFAYTPVSAEWTRNGHGNINYPVFLISTGALTIVLDLITLSYPLFVIRTLHVTRRKKFVIAGMFLLGALCVVASIIRLPYRVLYLQAVGSIAGGEKHAFDLELVPKILLWGLIEVDLAVIAACLPTYAPLLHDRALESVVRSARSIISLRSRESGSSGSRRRREDVEDEEAKSGWLAMQTSHYALTDHVSNSGTSTEGGVQGIRMNHGLDATNEEI